MNWSIAYWAFALFALALGPFLQILQMLFWSTAMKLAGELASSEDPELQDDNFFSAPLMYYNIAAIVVVLLFLVLARNKRWVYSLYIAFITLANVMPIGFSALMVLILNSDALKPNQLFCDLGFEANCYLVRYYQISWAIIIIMTPMWIAAVVVTIIYKRHKAKEIQYHLVMNDVAEGQL